MPAVSIQLRYPAACVRCSLKLAPGTTAWWDPETKHTTCAVCHVAEATSELDDRGRVIGVPGQAARREYERRQSNREARVLAQHRYTGKLRVAFAEQPQHETAWAKGARGERLLGERLSELAAEGMWVFHDQCLPGKRANIDHIVVAPSGVWVIDAKRYEGKLVQPRGRDLYVGGRCKTNLIEGMVKQTMTISGILGPDRSSIPIRPVLCFVDARFGRFSKPPEIGGVLVTWGKDLRARIRSAPSVIEVAPIGRVLESNLRAA